MFESTDQIENRIDGYLRDCRARGEERRREVMPTPSGLALALGFDDWEQMMSFTGETAHRAAIRRGISKLQQAMEERLFDKEMSAGAKLLLEKVFWELQKGGESGEDRQVREMLDGVLAP